VGYILLGLLSWDETTGTLTKAASTGIAYYLLSYVFMTAGAFAVIIVLRQKGLIGEELEDLNGLYQRSPAAAVLLLIFMLSLAGIPPTAGFMGKYFIFLSLIETHHPVLAVFAVLYIVPALYYYFPYRRPRLAQAARRSPASHHDQRPGPCLDHRRICHPRRRVVS